jgi:hypothetical protein|tara:strand:- start:7428 stop:7817 length:390 start_codon:yes stop_codon:yes gene_type:complete
MAHFAQLKNSTNNAVVRVIVVHDNEAPTEEAGIAFLKGLYGEDTIWKQTSYNTRAGEHLLGGTPFRKNFAGSHYVYDETRDAFIAPQPYPSWTLNETTCCWDPPVPMPPQPDPDGRCKWDEENQQWVSE